MNLNSKRKGSWRNRCLVRITHNRQLKLIQEEIVKLLEETSYNKANKRNHIEIMVFGGPGTRSPLVALAADQNGDTHPDVLQYLK